MCHGFEQQLIIVGRLAFRQFDDDAFRVDATVMDKAQSFIVPGRRIEQMLRAHVQEKFARQIQFGKTFEYDLAAQMFDLAQHTCTVRHFEQVQRRMQRTVGRSAYQSFKADDFTALHMDYGLEQGT